MGIMLAMSTSIEIGGLEKKERGRAEALLVAAGLPVVPPDLGSAGYVSHMQYDKKVSSGRLNFILLTGLGAAYNENSVPESILSKVLGTTPF